MKHGEMFEKCITKYTLKATATTSKTVYHVPGLNFVVHPFTVKLRCEVGTLDINILYNEFLHSLWLVTATSWK